MKTILIAPYQRDLARVPDEVEDVANLLNARIVQGAVDLARFFRELSGGQWELIWIASHGDEEGIQLSDGIISGDTLAAALRGTSARLIVLNTCSSETAAQRLYSAAGVPILCNVGPVPDTAAYATARRFAQELADGRDVAGAFAMAKTSTFRLIPEGLAMYNRQEDEISRLARRVDTTEQRVQAHEDLFYGRPDSPGLIHEMARAMDRMSEIRIILWIMILMFAAMLGTLAIMVNLFWQAAG